MLLFNLFHNIIIIMISDEKKILRKKIWSFFPQSSYGRIPIFNDAVKAADMLRRSVEWLNSRYIFVSPDSVQLKIREYVFLDEKTLIMATPKLKNGYLLINPDNVKGQEKFAATLGGAFKFGKSIKKLSQVDLMLEGSVAVDLGGGRLGKGGGFGDQEISHLLNYKSISTSTPIVTLIDEKQIVKNVPREAYDMNINMIVTPKRIIRINSRGLSKI
jgi:5-formyltetrahydrofolate cyclo-ligase